MIERRSLVPFAPLFPDEAEAALKVFKSLRMVDVLGKPTFGEACEPFVFDLVRAIFGSYDKVNNKRLITEFMLLISKKNGKSTIAAGIMLTALLRNWRDLAELIIVAPSQRVALNSFRPAAAMVRASPELLEMIHIVENEKTLRHRLTQAELKVVAAESGTLGGIKAGFVLFDEMWLFGKRANAEGMIEEATGGLASRPEGFTVYLSTHSDEPPAGVWKDKLEYFRDVRDGVINDPSSLGLLYEWPAAMIDREDYLKPENFYITNPNLGRSVTAEYISGKLRKAAGGEMDDDGDTGSQQVVLAKYLNVEIGLRLRRDRWRGADYWSSCADQSLTMAALIERSEVVVIGIDGGGLDDLYGLCVAGREMGTGRWLYWYKAWAWPDVLKRRKQIAPTLRGFAKDGDLVLCEERDMTPAVLSDEADYTLPQDISEIVALACTVKASGKMPEKYAIGVDAAGIADLREALTEAGFDGDDEVTAIRQGFGLMSAILGLARKLKFGTAQHNGSPMMDWCVGNAKEVLGRQTVMIDKYANGVAKIDPFMAGLNATKLLEAGPVAAENGKVSIDQWIKGMRAA